MEQKVNSFVGMFIVVGAVYGICDEVFDDGKVLGFLHGKTGDYWEQQLVAADKARLAVGDEVGKARTSAKAFLTQEIYSLSARLDKHLKIDESQRPRMEQWLKRYKAMLADIVGDDMKEKGTAA